MLYISSNIEFEKRFGLIICRGGLKQETSGARGGEIGGEIKTGVYCCIGGLKGCGQGTPGRLTGIKFGGSYP
jgi:hypothetical protein